jgi:hypothetical protein
MPSRGKGLSARGGWLAGFIVGFLCACIVWYVVLVIVNA